MKYALHQDFCYLHFSPPLCAPVLLAVAPVLRLTLKKLKIPKGISVSRHVIVTPDGLSIPTEVYQPAEERGELPCLLYFHGGAFCFPAAPYHQQLAMRYAKEAHCAVIFPDYHLLPKYTFSIACQDALHVYQWIMRNTAFLGIDAAKVAVGGDSAGAVLAAKVCAQASSNLCFQMLVYPVTDHRMETVSMKRYIDTPLWNAKLNRKMWKMVASTVSDDQMASLSPITWETPLSIPPTYIETAEFDCLHDEGFAYAKKLEACGATVILYETFGTVHGYDIVRHSQVTEESIRIRIKNLIQAFH